MTDVAFATGGAGGIGRAIVQRLIESGYAVINGDLVDDANEFFSSEWGLAAGFRRG